MEKPDSSGEKNQYRYKIIVGLVEPVFIKGKMFMARIDTGAAKSSICQSVLDELKIKPSKKEIKVRSAHGTSVRPVVRTIVKIASKKIRASFSVIDRGHMKYEILIGRNILRKGFLVDATKGAGK